MKKIICAWLLIALLLTAALPAVAESTSTADLLIGQIANLMDAREQIYEIRIDVLQRLSVFCRKNDYPSLLNARVACDDAIRALQNLTPPLLTLSDEELAGLMRAGVDTDELEKEFLAMNSTITYEIDNMVMYKTLLYSAVYQESQQDTLSDWCSIGEEKMALEAQYNCCVMNVLLLPFSGQAEVVSFWEAIPQRWPAIGEGMCEWENERNALNEKTVALLNTYEELIDEASVVSGRDAYAAEQYAEKISQDDIEALKEDTHLIFDMPTMVPLPGGWLIPGTSSMYGYRDETQPGSPLDTVILCDNAVSLQPFMEYIEYLTSLETEIYSQKGGDEEGWQYVLMIDGHALALYWYPEQRAIVSYDPRYLTLETTAYILCCQ